jgi:glycosyltransferase involved in cell wall biosynthesis
MKAVFRRSGKSFTPPVIIGSKPTLSVCMTVLEDREEANLTIESIKETAGDVDIVVVDDASKDPVDIKYSGVSYKRNSSRMGVGPSRDVAVSMAKGSYAMIIDSHMRFKPGWYQNAMDRLGDPMQAWNGCCLGLDADNMDINKPKGEYCGANLVLWDQQTGAIFGRFIFREQEALPVRSWAGRIEAVGKR